jgi:hypothetical protein
MRLTGGLMEIALFLAIDFPLRLRFANLNRRRLPKLAGVNIEKCIILAPLHLPQFKQMRQLTIGKGTFINFDGAVVTKNVEQYTLAGGVPSRLMKRIK